MSITAYLERERTERLDNEIQAMTAAARNISDDRGPTHLRGPGSTRNTDTRWTSRHLRHPDASDEYRDQKPDSRRASSADLHSAPASVTPTTRTAKTLPRFNVKESAEFDTSQPAPHEFEKSDFGDRYNMYPNPSKNNSDSPNAQKRRRSNKPPRMPQTSRKQQNTALKQLMRIVKLSVVLICALIVVKFM